MSYTASINLEDGQIRFWADGRLDDDEYNAVKQAGLRWRRGEQCFRGAWTPAKVDFLAEHFGIEELEEDGTDLMERAESRGDHYQGFSDNAKKRSDGHYEASNAATRGIPMGQPILVGHHSEKRHRAALKRSHTNMRKSIDEGERAGYWQGRAERAVKAQAYKERPDVIARRIKKLEADLRRSQRAGAERWIAFLEERISFQKALYDASGGTISEQINFEPGDYVRSGYGWRKVVRVNKKSLTIESGYSWTNRIGYDEVRQHMPADKVAEIERKAEEEKTPEPGGGEIKQLSLI